MSVSSFALDVAAGTISGAIVAALPVLGRSLKPVADSSRSEQSDHPWIDQSRHRYTTLIDARPTTITVRGADREGEPEEPFAIALVIAGVALVAFLFAWPLALGFLLGSCVVTAVWYLHIAFVALPGRRDLVVPAVVHTLATAATTVATCMFVLFANTGGDGLLHIERELDTRFPRYDSSIPARWHTLTQHLGIVFSLIGGRGSMVLLFEIGGLVICALLTALLVLRAIGTLALLQVEAGRGVSKWRARLASNVLIENRPKEVAITALMAAISVAFASGLAFDLANAAYGSNPLEHFGQTGTATKPVGCVTHHRAHVRRHHTRHPKKVCQTGS